MFCFQKVMISSHLNFTIKLIQTQIMFISPSFIILALDFDHDDVKSHAGFKLQNEVRNWLDHSWAHDPWKKNEDGILNCVRLSNFFWLRSQYIYKLATNCPWTLTVYGWSGPCARWQFGSSRSMSVVVKGDPSFKLDGVKSSDHCRGY